MTAHTATPWIWNKDDQLVSSVAKDHNENPVLIVETDSGFYPPFKDDREFLALACNAHDDLVKALRSAVKTAGGMYLISASEYEAALAKVGAAGEFNHPAGACATDAAGYDNPNVCAKDAMHRI